MQRALHEEGSPNEAVRGADEAHDRDLLATCQDGEPDGVVDEHHCDEDQQGDERDADVADVVRKIEQTLHALLTVFQRIGRIARVVADLGKRSVRLDLPGDRFDHLRIGQLHFDGSRKRILAVKLVDDLGVRGHRIAEVLERLLFGGEAHALNPLETLNVALERRDIAVARIV